MNINITLFCNRFGYLRINASGGVNTDMEDHLEIIETLKQELEHKDHDIQLAAIIGKSLLEENNKLSEKHEIYLSQIEFLEQEKHSVQLQLDAKMQIVQNQAAETETLKENLEKLTLSCEQLKKENLQINRKVQDVIIENDELKKTQEEISQNESACRKRIKLLEEQLQEVEEQMQNSFLNETSNDDIQRLQNEIHICIKEKQALQDAVSEMHNELSQSSKKELKLARVIENLQEKLHEKESELTVYLALSEKAKEESSDLEAEIEILKMQQTDVNRRGNSIFGELEDRRKAVEKELITLRASYKSMKERYELSFQQLQKSKHQVAALLSMTSQKVDISYIEKLEKELCGSQKEIEQLNNRLSEVQKTQLDLISSALNTVAEQITPTEDGYNYLRTLLQQSQNRIKILEKELLALRLCRLADSDKLMQTQHSLYQSEKTVQSLQGEILQMKLSLNELKMKFNEKSKPLSKSISKSEIIPGFEKLEDKENKEPNVCLKEKEQCKENSFVVVCKENPSMVKISLQKEQKSATEKKTVSISNTVTIHDGRDQLKTEVLNSSFRSDLKIRKSGRKVTAPTITMSNDNSNCAQQ